MISETITKLSPQSKQLLENSTANPKMYALIKNLGKEDSQITLEIGVKSTDNNVFVKTISKRYSDFELLDKNIKKYFKSTQFLQPLPGKKAERKIELLQDYLTQMFAIPGICIFPPFLLFFSLNVELFVQQ